MLENLPLTLLLRPTNLTETVRPVLRMLNRMSNEHHRAIDVFCSRLVSNSVFYPHGFFKGGFGDYSIVEQFGREIRQSKEGRRPPIVAIEPELRPTSTDKALTKEVICQEGSFASTLSQAHLLPTESQTAHFRFVQPKDWNNQKHKTAVVLLPGLGEFGYGRRHAAVALPLAEDGVASVILEGPFFGARMPPTQKRSKLEKVTDLLVLGRATIEEARSLLQWLKEGLGADSVVVAGCSMGGLHASMTGSMMPFATGIVAHMPPPSAGHAFCDGVLFNSLAKELKEMIDAEDGRQDDLVIEKLKSFMAPSEIVNFPVPLRPDLAVITLGKSDQYVPSVAVDVWFKEICQRWNGCKVQEIDAGHVTGLLVERGPYRKAISRVIQHLQQGPTEG